MSDTALFDMQPVERPDVEAELSADQRRTLRQWRDVADGFHPLLVSLYGRTYRSVLHPEAPSDTQQGQRGRPYTCGTCVHRITRRRANTYIKCAADDGKRITGGPATDIRNWWPACLSYSAGDSNLSPDAARWIPEVSA